MSDTYGPGAPEAGCSLRVLSMLSRHRLVVVEESTLVELRVGCAINRSIVLLDPARRTDARGHGNTAYDLASILTASALHPHVAFFLCVNLSIHEHISASKLRSIK